jgi:hypothetical protein
MNHWNFRIVKFSNFLVTLEFWSTLLWRQPHLVLELCNPLHLKLELVRVLLVVVEHGKGLTVVDAVGAAENVKKIGIEVIV